MTTYWQDNLAVLRQQHPELFSLLTAHEYRPVGEMLETLTGYPTMRFPSAEGTGPLAYNLHDPWRDAAVHLTTVEQDSRGLAVFVGLGLGYGPLHVLAERPTLGMLVIIEPDIDLLATALRHVDLRPLLQAEKVRWLVGDIDLAVFEQMIGRIASLEDTHILRHVPSFLWREKVYGSLNHQVFGVINELNALGATTRKAGERFFRNRLANLCLLRQSHELGAAKNLFAGKPAVLVAAGPSLDQSIAELKQVAGKCVLFAVDSALAPLLKADIMPDFVTTIDFQELNFEKLAPFVSKEWPFSLIATIKVTPLITKRFKARRLLWAFNDDIPQKWLQDALGVQELVSFPSSVAHLSLAAALSMGCDPIILVGQDLGYTTGQGDHAEGTIIMQHGPMGRETFQVPGVGGSMVATDRGMLTIQKRFEDIIVAHPDRTYFNATAAGARIQGTIEATLLTLAPQYLKSELPVQEMVDQAVTAMSGFPPADFAKKIQQILQGIKKIERQLHEVLGIAREAKRELVRLQRKQPHIHGFDGLPVGLAKKLAKFDRVNRSIDGAQILSEQILELTYPALSENDWQREQNETIRIQGVYLAWLQAEIERIDAVNQERGKAFALYRDLLGQLSQRLAAEEKYLARSVAVSDAERLIQARAYAESGEYHLARALVEQLLARDPDAPDAIDALMLAGQAAAALLLFDQANDCWLKAMSRAPERAAEMRTMRWQQAEYWIRLADQHGNAGEVAEDQFVHLLPIWLARVAGILVHEEEVPDSLQQLWRKHATRMEEWLAVGETDSVVLTLRSWECFGGRFPEVDIFRARLAAVRGEDVTAISIMAGIVRQYPSHPQWLALLARLLLEAGNFEEGIASLQKAVALDPATATLWEELGDSLLARGDANEAAMAYEHCYLAQPYRIDLLSKLGDAHLAARQPAAAVAAYQAVLAKKPADELAAHRLIQARALADRLAVQG